MADGMMELTDANWEAEVLQSNTPVLVDFTAPWCQPCKQIAPILDALAGEYRGRIKIGKINVDENENVPQKYKVMNLPTMLFFNGGRETGKLAGAVGRAKIEAEIKAQLG
jgi:thioredoxin 1